MRVTDEQLDRLWRIRETLADFADIAALELAISALSHAAGQDVDKGLPWRDEIDRMYVVGWAQSLRRINDYRAYFIEHGYHPEYVAVRLERLLAAVARSEGKVEIIAKVQLALGSLEVPKMTPARAEYWKAGARAAIHAVNKALASSGNAGGERG